MMTDVRVATGLDRPEILGLLREMIPGIDAEARWRWLYEANPGGPALTWIATENGQLAGCTSFFPFRLWLDGEIVHAALGGDGFVRPDLRRNGVGRALHYASRNAMETQRIGCMYGAPGAPNVTPLKRGGSREIGRVARWVRPIRASALGVRTPIVRRLAVAPPIGAAELEPMQRSDPRVDAVWAQARRELRLAAVRDAAFYTWRFLEAPANTQSAYVIVDRHLGRHRDRHRGLLGPRTGDSRADHDQVRLGLGDDAGHDPCGEALGACAVEPTHGGTTLRIVDLITVPGAWHACLRAIVGHAIRHTRADRVDIKLFALDGRRRQMWRSGFVERESKPFLCMIPRRGDRRFLDPDRWYYNGADSDLDTLE